MKRAAIFSDRLLAIEVELDALISSVGGIDGLKLLDRLSQIPEASRVALVKKFLNDISDNSTSGIEVKESRKPDCKKDNVIPLVRYYR